MPISPAIFRQWNFNLPVAGFAMNRDGTWLALAMGDGTLRLLAANDEVEQPKEMEAHKGIALSLTADADGHAFLSGGDDGKVLIIDPDLTAPTLLAEHKGKWIDHVAASDEGGFRAYSAGKQVTLLNDEGQVVHNVTLPSSAGGLGFSPNGKRLAASHYNGVSLIWTNAKSTEVNKLEWKGSHLGLIWHPDGKMLLTSLQESALHGWRFSDNAEMRMQGYAAKIMSMAFTPKAKYLATSGAEQVICWPFFGGGPWGKSPLTLGGSDGRLVTCVAPHPKDEMVAAGYGDGMIVLAPLDGRMEVMINPPAALDGAGVIGMAWNRTADCLFAALENGTVMLFTIDSVRKAARHV